MKTTDPQSFDHFADRYEDAVMLERRHDFFLRHLPACRRRALDLGCGTGSLAKELSRHFQAVIGIDLSAPMLAIARAKRSAPNLVFRQADADRLELREKFDLIASHTTFHHLKEVPRVVKTLCSSLEVGGRLVIVDLVDRWRGVPRNVTAVHIGAACARFVPDVFRHGVGPAGRLFRFKTSRPWLDHLIADRYLTPTGFRELYGRLLPGASFTRMNHFSGVIWRRPS